jgi:hypothetical protein
MPGFACRALLIAPYMTNCEETRPAVMTSKVSVCIGRPQRVDGNCRVRCSMRGEGEGALEPKGEGALERKGEGAFERTGSGSEAVSGHPLHALTHPRSKTGKETAGACFHAQGIQAVQHGPLGTVTLVDLRQEGVGGLRLSARVQSRLGSIAHALLFHIDGRKHSSRAGWDPHSHARAPPRRNPPRYRTTG